jgi:hypothetical protein
MGCESPPQSVALHQCHPNFTCKKNIRLVLMTTNNKPKETKYESVRLASVAIPRLVFDAWVSPSVSWFWS